MFALSVTRVSRSKSGFRYLSIDLDSEIGTKGNIEFDHDERNRLIYFREEISRGRVFFNREKAEYDFLFYCKYLKSVYFFLTFCTLYSRDIIIRCCCSFVIISHDFPVYFFGIFNNCWKITKINDRLYPEQSG